MIDLVSLDHLVLSVTSIERTTNFYSNILGLELYVYEGRYGARIGDTVIKFRLVTDKPLVARSLCFITTQKLDSVVQMLEQWKIPIEMGPVIRNGADGKLNSIYIRDPNEHLIEISNRILT